MIQLDDPIRPFKGKILATSDGFIPIVAFHECLRLFEPGERCAGD